jgi:hypothetical protein
MDKHLFDAAMDDNDALENLADQERESHYEDRDSPQSRTASVTNPNGRDLDYHINNTGHGGDYYVSSYRHGPIGYADSNDEAEELIRSHAAKQLGLSGIEGGQKNIDKPNVHDVGIYGEGSKWSLPGVTDFREHTLHLDPPNGDDYEAGHYDPNAVVHMRYGTVHDANGKRLLLLDEVQSDLHQNAAGIAKVLGHGYNNDAGREAAKNGRPKLDKLTGELNDLRDHIGSQLGFEGGTDRFAGLMLLNPNDPSSMEDYRHQSALHSSEQFVRNRNPDLANAMFGGDRDPLSPQDRFKKFHEYSREALGENYKKQASDLNSLATSEQNLRKALSSTLPPDLPWKNTSDWTKLAMKRALRIAADYGYDGVALSPGWVQKQRWGNDDHEKLYDDLMGGSMKSLAKQESLNFGTASIPLLRTHARNTRVAGVDNPDQAHAIYLEDEHKDKIRKQGFKLLKRGGFVPPARSSAVEQALKLTSKSGATLPAAVFLARQHQRRD